MNLLVTGGTSGLGLAMASALAAGATVAPTGRSGQVAGAVDGFRAMIDTDLTGYFLAAREVTPRMLAAGGGRIVNISVRESTMNRAGFVPCGPSQAGSEALSRIMAADRRGTGVTVNLLLPGGATATGMLPKDLPDAQGRGPHFLERP
jgi:NAD(P)-dependent dehydrogenase (short-subunit alcohol dehydrogenase family)